MPLQRADRLADRRLADAVNLRRPGEAFSFCQVAEDLEAFKMHNGIEQKSCFPVNYGLLRSPRPTCGAAPRLAREAVLAVNEPGGYTPRMIILTNTGGVAMTNCFLIADETARQAVLFDAPDHTVEPLLKRPPRGDGT